MLMSASGRWETGGGVMGTGYRTRIGSIALITAYGTA